MAFAKGKVPPVTGARSRNAYARYERGEAVPSIDTLERLLEAVRPGGDFVIRDSHR